MVRLTNDKRNIAIGILCICIVVLTVNIRVLSTRVVELKNKCDNEYPAIIDSLNYELFTYKKERVAGYILYNTFMMKPSLTQEEAWLLDSTMFAITDSSDIERLVNNYNLQGTIWDK